jgi:DNA helicase HerA-like ATPase
MVESAQAKVRDHHCFSRWPLFYRSVKRSVFGEAVVNPILVKVRNIAGDPPTANDYCSRPDFWPTSK